MLTLLPEENLKCREESKTNINNKFRTFAMIRPDGYLNFGKIINQFEDNGFTIGNIKMARMTRKDAEGFLAEQRGKANYNENVEFLCSDLCVGI